MKKGYDCGWQYVGKTNFKICTALVEFKQVTLFFFFHDFSHFYSSSLILNSEGLKY